MRFGGDLLKRRHAWQEARDLSSRGLGAGIGDEGNHDPRLCPNGLVRNDNAYTGENDHEDRSVVINGLI